jgi:hypothetical protein
MMKHFLMGAAVTVAVSKLSASPSVKRYVKKKVVKAVEGIIKDALHEHDKNLATVYQFPGGKQA